MLLRDAAEYDGLYGRAGNIHVLRAPYNLAYGRLSLCQTAPVSQYTFHTAGSNTVQLLLGLENIHIVLPSIPLASAQSIPPGVLIASNIWFDQSKWKYQEYVDM